MKGAYLLTGSLLLLSGCISNKAAVDPYAYAPAKASTEWKPRSQEPAPPVTPSAETVLSLAEILDIALQNNPSTKLTWAKARAAAADYGTAQSPDFPTLTGMYQYIRSRSSQAGSSQSAGTGGITPIGGNSVDPNAPVLINYFISQWGPQFQFNYTLLDFGQSRAAADSAKLALYNAGYTHNRQLQTVVQQVTNNYYNYLYQQELLKANEADLETAQTTYDAAKLGLESGVKALSDALQAQTKLIQSQILLISQKQNLVNALASLLTSMGVDANKRVQVQELPDIPPIEQMLKNADDLLVLALQKRADLLAAQSELKSQDANVRAARRQFLPTLTYNLAIGETTYTKLGSDGYDFTGTLSLNLPIFSGFTTLNNLKKAKALKEQAEANLRQTQLTVIQDVTTNHAQVKSSFESLKFADEYLQTAEKQYDVALARYKSGVGNIIDLTTAQSSFADARAKHANATNQWFTSLVNLSYAAGILEAPSSGVQQ